ncbi:IS110 family transposase [Paenibacillus sp. ALE1]
MQSKRARGTTLRKVKTDAADAWHLDEMFYRGDLKPHRAWHEAHTEIQNVTRQHEFITSLYVQAKLNTRALFDQVFPEYEPVFYDLYSVTALKVLQAWLQGKVKNASQSLFEHARLSHSRKWINDRAELLDIALKQKAKVNRSISQHSVLEGMITLLLAFQSQLEILETQMGKISVNQLIHHIYTILSKNEPYRP